MTHESRSKGPMTSQDSVDALGLLAQTQPDGTVLHFRALPPMALCGGPESPYRVQSCARSASASVSSEESTPKPSSD